ncbi:MAG: PepSY-like domain-containing protein [Bacteroidota bacterium]
MKKIFLGLALMLTIAVTAQKNDAAPAAAKAAFAKAYPNATKVKWEKEDGNYEVSFVDKGNELSAIYNAKGVLQESEHEMKVSELPANIQAYMKEHYKGITVKGAAKITKADGSINYEAAIKGKDVLFDANGKFLKESKD